MLPPLLTPTLPPLLIPTVSVSTPTVTLPPLRVRPTPVDRSLPRWIDCLFYLSAKQGGGYVRAEEVDALFRSGDALTPLPERKRSYSAKRVTLPTLQLPALLSPVSPNGQDDASTTSCAHTSSPTLPALTIPTLPPLSAHPAGTAAAVASTPTLPPLVSAAAAANKD